MKSVAIRKHFVSVSGRRVHYLRHGVGPVLVLLHASACSAKVMRDHIACFGQKFTVIAPDTPGFGLSDLLPMESVTTEDLADALAETLDALGIQQVSVYGRHTGAQIAVEFAARHPQRCAMALSDGFPFTPCKNASADWPTTCRRLFPALMAAICSGCGFATANNMCSGPGMRKTPHTAPTPMCPMCIFCTGVWLKCWRRAMATGLVTPRLIGTGAWTPVPT